MPKMSIVSIVGGNADYWGWYFKIVDLGASFTADEASSALHSNELDYTTAVYLARMKC